MSFPARSALLMSLSLIGIALACWPHSVLGVDAARVPKEALFYLAALGCLCLDAGRVLRVRRPAEWWLIAFVGFSLLASTHAVSPSLSYRADVITVASCVFFL